MTETPRPTKRAKQDFRSTFDVLVGQEPGRVERFTVHADVFTQRSRFFATARKPEWLAGDSSKPVDLSDEDPDIFQAYLNCVYVGAETLEEIPGSFESEVRESTGGFPDVWVKNNGKEVITKETPIGYFERFGEIEKVDLHSTGKAAVKASDGLIMNCPDLTVEPLESCPKAVEEWHTRELELADSHYDTLIALYLLADKLQDLATANMVIDKIQEFCKAVHVLPGKAPICAAYKSTVHGSPLRKLLRDLWFYDTGVFHPKQVEESGLPNEFLHDTFKEYIRIKFESDDVKHFRDISSNDWLLEEPESDVPSVCRYHHHDDQHPFCSTSSKKEKEHHKS